jgi:hypothetical protein
VRVTEELGALVCEKWTSVLEDGFEIVDQRAGVVELRSATVCIRVVLDPRGEVDVDAYPVGGDPHLGWAYTGIVGRASAGRLLEVALEQMRREPEVLRGDLAFYEEIARQRAAEAHALNEFYAGPRPEPAPQPPSSLDPSGSAASH